MKYCSIIGLLCLAVGAPAWGSPVTTIPEVMCSITMGDGEPVTWPAANGRDNGDGSFSYHGQRTQADEWGMTFDITADPDPFVNAVVGVTNNSPVTQVYVFTISLPIFPALPSPTLSGGSTTAGLTDANGNGSATLSALPALSMYLGMIDGVGVLPLLPPGPGALTIGPGGIPFSSVSTSVNAVPPAVPTGAALSFISIRHAFSLSPGDLAAFTSAFVVIPDNIPEPATLALLGGGMLMLARRRPRH